MKSKMMKNGVEIARFDKIGKYNFAVLQNSEKLPASSIGEIEIECNTCKSVRKINYRSALIKKEYNCQRCLKLGDKNSFYGKTHTVENKLRQSELMRGKYTGEANPFYGKKHSSETKQFLSTLSSKRIGELNPFYGKKHTKQSIETIVHKNKKYRETLTDEERKLISQKISQKQKDCKDNNSDYYRQIKKKAASSSTSSQGRYKMNSLEKKVEKLLQEHTTIEFAYSVILGSLQYDFGNKEHRILIEVHGDYWHANPEIFGEGKRPLNSIQIRKRESDKLKEEFAERHNMKLIVLWERDINLNINKVIEEITREVRSN